MSAIRRLLAQRTLAVLLCAAALLLKLLVPAGYMIGGDHGRITIELCPGTVAMPSASGTAAPMAADMHGAMPDHAPSGDHGKGEMPCAFAGLSAASLGAVDPIQLAALLACVMAIWLFPVVPRVAMRQVRLRPPLRAPPPHL